MGKLRVLSSKQVCRILADNGFVLVRQKGSHFSMQKSTSTSTVTVVVPEHRQLHVGTLLSIIRQSGLARELFETQS